MYALIIAATLIATDPRIVLVGRWDGESICTPVRTACRDEHAVYHITIPKKAGVVDMLMSKVVDGKEVGMGGTVEYTVNEDATSLTSEYTYNGNHLRWSFSRTGNEMRGTLTTVPDGAVIRNIRVAKK